ncbi:hypothetical protein ACFFKB_24285 [Mameliella alba]|uniref:hypothetical protein n=1 Tax=Mameliella alba TaxID=561184 RepID=UPI001056DA35|nr:hypothetical protein [Mameliella alba]
MTTIICRKTLLALAAKGHPIMILYNDAVCRVSQGFFRGWRVENKLQGMTLVPSALMSERIGFVWMMVRRTKKSRSISWRLSENRMFQEFAMAVMFPDSPAAELWKTNTPDDIADSLIEATNHEVRELHDARREHTEQPQMAPRPRETPYHEEPDANGSRRLRVERKIRKAQEALASGTLEPSRRASVERALRGYQQILSNMNRRQSEAKKIQDEKPKNGPTHDKK